VLGNEMRAERHCRRKKIGGYGCAGLAASLRHQRIRNRYENSNLCDPLIAAKQGVGMKRIAAILLSVLACGNAHAADRFITLSSTTSTQDSGLFGHILPIFKAASGIDVHVVAVGTGQALAIGQRGDADALLVHDRPGEDKFVAEGYGIDRRDVMYNDFVIVGPKTDPAHIRGLKDARKALRQIAAAKAPFASRHQSDGVAAMEVG